MQTITEIELCELERQAAIAEFDELIEAGRKHQISTTRLGQNLNRYNEANAALYEAMLKAIVDTGVKVTF